VTAWLADDYASGRLREGEGRDKARFFELANEELAKEPVAEKYACMDLLNEDSEGDVLDRIRRFNPGWTITEHRESGGAIEAILTEDITLKSVHLRQPRA
jgi:hypothetical protein